MALATKSLVSAAVPLTTVLMLLEFGNLATTGESVDAYYCSQSAAVKNPGDTHMSQIIRPGAVYPIPETICLQPFQLQLVVNQLAE